MFLLQSKVLCLTICWSSRQLLQLLPDIFTLMTSIGLASHADILVKFVVSSHCFPVATEYPPPHMACASLFIHSSLSCPSWKITVLKSWIKKTVWSSLAGCWNKCRVYSVSHFGPLPKVTRAFGKYCPWVNALELNVHNNPCGGKSQSSSKGAQLEPLLIVQIFLSILFKFWSCIVQHKLLGFVHSYYPNHWVQFFHCFDITYTDRVFTPLHRPNRSGLQPQHRELGAAQLAGAAAVPVPPDGGEDHLPHLHRQPHQAGLPVRTRLLHWVQRCAQDLPHLSADNSRADPVICVTMFADDTYCKHAALHPHLVTFVVFPLMGRKIWGEAA